ncbi:hypothetical protein P1X15_15240 [Runella sp. MFBS21]|uniref:SGNH/GDSL hydrolase family protein n=1 Tax=Runella sp. MFBS21 TaxID=3034018 RepID=UPI0023F6D59A|nr:SGNH/GDSL hydrolase family protein [Runella sp. MFBS21]MDF7818970.1 hypothetical protein [Runella sp. MFBS21]
MRFRKKFLFILLALLGVFELLLRFGFGFCNAPLYIEDPDFEYIFAPNQYRFRFRNVVKTNEFSLRSEPINPADTTVVLLVGDSVINGGNPTDHDDLASTILEKQLTQHYKQTIRVLNVSAGSWGPDNAFAFLKKKGFFGADVMCLVTSSHDAYDNMSHHKIVGVNPNYPEKQYKVALYEFWHRYIYNLFIYHYVEVPLKEWLSPATQQAPNDVIHKFGTTFNAGYQQLADTTKALGIPFFMYLHPELPEIDQNQYDSQGKEILDFARKNHIFVIDELKINQKEHSLTRDLFRSPEFDSIHYNAKGQAYMAKHLYPVLKQYLDAYFSKHARTHRP